MGEHRLTGYPSIDRPWLRYYREGAVDAPLPQENLYGYIRRRNEGHGEDIAIRHEGRELSYSGFFSQIDIAATAFSELGVRAGDIVSFLAVTTPEILVSVYALNKIGAVCDMLDPRMSVDTIALSIKRTDPKLVVVTHLFLEKTRPLHQRIVVVGADTSALDETGYDRARYLSWEGLIEIGNRRPPVSACPYEKDMPALIEHTGGTTGTPKGVLLSNDNINSVPEQYRHNGTTSRRGDLWQCVAAPFIAYVMILSTHVPLSLGITCEISAYDLDLIASDILKGRYAHVAADPAVWEKVMSDPKSGHADLSRLIMPISGADVMSPVLEEKIDRFLAAHGCKNVVCNGYGMTESGIAGCMELSKSISRIGSVGIPFVKTLIAAFTEDTTEELPYHEIGELCIHGPSVMMGYIGDRRATEEVLKVHRDGRVWLHTGDHGYVDEDGFVFLIGRIKRMLVKCDGAKVFPSVIEKVLLTHDLVKKCAVIGAQDPRSAVGQVPEAFVVIEERAKGQEVEVRRELSCLCEKRLPEYALPERYHFVEGLPVTPIGKIDVRALERLAARL